MPLFHYRAINHSGRKLSGQMDARNLDDLEIRLKHMTLDLIDGQLVKGRVLFASTGIPRRELIHFCFHLDMLVQAGIPILDGLTDLRDTVAPLRVRKVMSNLIEAIAGGHTLSQAMAAQPKVFDKVFTSLIHAGETAGRLPEILKSLTETLKWEDELISQTQKIILYPAFVASIILSASCFLMIYLVPQLKSFVHSMGQSLPIQTQVLFAVSDILIDYWQLCLLLPVAGWLGAQAVLHTSPGARTCMDRLKLCLPLTGAILHKIILSRFTKTFALLYASGIPIIETLRTTQEVVGNRAIRRELEHIEQSISNGANVTAAFHAAGFFPPFIIRMMRVGESTGGLDEALLNVSYFYTRDVRESVDKTQQLIEPILTVLLGGLLGWIMLSVLGPFYDVISTLKT